MVQIFCKALHCFSLFVTVDLLFSDLYMNLVVFYSVFIKQLMFALQGVKVFSCALCLLQFPLGITSAAIRGRPHGAGICASGCKVQLFDSPKALWICVCSAALTRHLHQPVPPNKKQPIVLLSVLLGVPVYPGLLFVCIRVKTPEGWLRLVGMFAAPLPGGWCF